MKCFIPLLFLFGLVSGHTALLGQGEIFMERIPAHASLRMSIVTWEGFGFELQESDDLVNWNTSSNPYRGTGEWVSIIRPESQSRFFRFRGYQIFAPVTFPFEVFELITLIGFDVINPNIQITRLDDSNAEWTFEGTDPATGLIIGEKGRMTYTSSQVDFNTVNFGFFIDEVSATNPDTNETLTFTVAEFAELSSIVLPVQVVSIYNFTGPDMGTVQSVTRNTDGTEIVENGVFPAES